MSIPIVIGVTGHRDPREKALPRVRALVEAELRRLIRQYPNSDFVLLDAIAAGADTLCADVALQLGMALVCPLPLPPEEYRKDFNAAEKDTFDALMHRASDVFVAPGQAGASAPLTRDDAYRRAGEYVASHCHVLLALWDGTPAKKDGCGTAEIVEYMLNGYDGFRADNDGAVLHIMTPRTSGGDREIAARLIEKRPGGLADALRRTDAFNADARTSGTENGDELLPEAALASDSPLKRLLAVYRQANALSLINQKKYLSAMRRFSVFGMMLVLSFLLYDEMESPLFLMCYGALMLMYPAAYLTVRRKAYHAKYLQYRMLSETFRTQFYLTAAGIAVNIGDSFTWTQKQDATWIKNALSALLIGGAFKRAASDDLIKTHWIDGQRAYHQKAFKLDSRKREVNEKAARIMLYASAALFVLVAALEFFFPSVMAAQGFMPGKTAVTPRCLLKILLGGVSAATVFLSNYYGKLSFDRKSADHERMALLYAAAKKRYGDHKEAGDRIFYTLAREEIIENGNRFSYCRENPPTFNL